MLNTENKNISLAVQLWSLLKWPLPPFVLQSALLVILVIAAARPVHHVSTATDRVTTSQDNVIVCLASRGHCAARVSITIKTIQDTVVTVSCEHQTNVRAGPQDKNQQNTHICVHIDFTAGSAAYTVLHMSGHKLGHLILVEQPTGMFSEYSCDLEFPEINNRS